MKLFKKKSKLFVFLGFFCSGGAKSDVPVDDDRWGGPCPAGYYCPEGTGVPKPCEPGTYNNDEQNEDCEICEAGFQCNGGFCGLRG